MFNSFVSFFFFNDTATTEIYTLSLHDALPISPFFLGGTAGEGRLDQRGEGECTDAARSLPEKSADRKSTRLNSSHSQISYAVFCLKKKKRTAVTRVDRSGLRSWSHAIGCSARP